MSTESNEQQPPCDGFKSWRKLKTLPRIIDEYEQCKVWYQRIKQQHWKISVCCSGIELVVYHLVKMLMAFYCADVVSPIACWMVSKVLFLDEFVFHQLEFVENQLKKINTEWIYKPSGLIERVYLSMCLMVRLVFIFPRLWYRFTINSADIIINEGAEIGEITSASENSHDEDDEHSGEEELVIVDAVEQVEIEIQPDEEIIAGPSKVMVGGGGIEKPDEVIAA